jgi:hypothetical protein
VELEQAVPLPPVAVAMAAPVAALPELKPGLLT